MKKIYLATGLVLGLLLPFEALSASGDDVTIRLMQMHEKSTQEVMNRLNLPEIKIDTVKQEANFKYRHIKRTQDAEGQGSHYEGDGPGESNSPAGGSSLGSGNMEQNQEQIRDTENSFDHESQMGQEHSEIENDLNVPDQNNEPHEDTPQGSGPGK